LGLLARVGRIMEQQGQIQWKYSDPTRRIRNNVVSATCHSSPTDLVWCTGLVLEVDRATLSSKGELAFLESASSVLSTMSLACLGASSPFFIDYPREQN
jgi:hypothetical protein